LATVIGIPQFTEEKLKMFFCAKCKIVFRSFTFQLWLIIRVISV
jgi:hypothetical protein